MFRLNYLLFQTVLMTFFVVWAVGCAPINNQPESNINISEDIRFKATDLVDFIDQSMNNKEITISDEEFLNQIELYQQVLVDKGKITKEMGQEMIDNTEKAIKNGDLTDDMKYSVYAGNKFSFYLLTVGEMDTLTLDEKKLDDLIYSMYFYALEYHSRKTPGSDYSIAFYTGDNPEEKEKANIKLKELGEIKEKDTKVLIEDYQNLYKEYVELIRTEKGDSKIKKTESIPFQEDQLYAVAYLGYDEIGDLSFYIQKYLDSDNIPVHYLSQGEYYLVIPRYSNMSLSLYKNDFQTSESSLIFEEKKCRPFIIQCNVSDIFPDATIRFAYNDETVEFSPYISLKDGSVVVGDRGINITK